MASQGSVTDLLGPLQAGDSAAVWELWQRYFPRLLGLARKRLRDAPRRLADEEDVALGALDSFCRRARDGQFPQLADREDLWRLLVCLTTRKAARLRRDEGRQKQGGGKAQVCGPAAEAELAQLLSREPSPATWVQMVETCQQLLACLGDPQLKAVAQWKMEGYTVEEIAQKLGCAPRTVKRKVQLIRTLWEKEVAP